MTTATTSLQEKYDALRKRFHGAILVLQAVRNEAAEIEAEASTAGVRLEGGGYSKAVPHESNDLLTAWIDHEKSKGRL